MVKGKKTKTKRRKPSKYSGKALDIEFREAVSGVAGKPDQLLFFEDKEQKVEPRRVIVKRKRKEKEKEKENKKKVVSVHEEKIVKRIVKSKRLRREEKKQGKVVDAWADEQIDNDEWDLVEKKSAKRARQARLHPSTVHKMDAVKVVHPAASYNPSVQDLKEGLEMAVEKHIEYTEKRKVVIPALESSKKLLVTEFGEQSESESESEEEEEEEEGKVRVALPGPTGSRRNRRIPGERITRVQKNKEKRKRQLHASKVALEREKKHLAAIDKVDKYNEQVLEKEKQSEERIERRAAREQSKLEQDRTPRVNARKKSYEPLVETVLPSDLSDTMRSMKPHRTFIMERFTSMHSRNLMDLGESRRRLGKKKQKNTYPVAVGQKFMDEFEDDKGHRHVKKKKARIMRNGKIDISV